MTSQELTLILLYVLIGLPVFITLLFPGGRAKHPKKTEQRSKPGG